MSDSITSENVYRCDHSYLLDTIAAAPGTFAGTAVLDPQSAGVAEAMRDLAGRGVRAFRIYPGLERGAKPNTASGAGWLAADGYATMFAAAARNGQSISCLINPDALPDLDRLCRGFPDTLVIIDHLCRIGVDGVVRAEDVAALCGMARHERVLVKVGAFYALGQKEAPYTDLGELIEQVVSAFGARRCMWESDCPYQVVGGHTYEGSIELVRSRLGFLSADDRAWMLGRTAESVFFPA